MPTPKPNPKDLPTFNAASTLVYPFANSVLRAAVTAFASQEGSSNIVPSIGLQVEAKEPFVRLDKSLNYSFDWFPSVF